jgi:hypothetical protein
MKRPILPRELEVGTCQRKGHAMKPKLLIAIVLLIAGTAVAVRADFPVAQSGFKDWLPAVAYNSTDHEYLVVWSEYIYNGAIWINWVMGQRVGEDGTLLGNAFVVYPVGVNPVVAYNSSLNEYLVGFNPGSGFVGQRVSSSGGIIGTPSTLMDGVSDGRLLYNSITGQYLFVGAIDVEPTAGTGYYNIHVSTCKINATGVQLTAPQLVVNRAHGYQPPGPAFAAAFAPIQSSETPAGRYLLAVGRGLVLYMLDSDGGVINIVSDPNHPGTYYKEIPFTAGEVTAGEYHVDVAYGDQSSYSMTGPAFLVVWSDQNNTWSGQSWNGVWGEFLDASKISYLTTETVYDHAFPVSGQADHFAYAQYIETWKPKVCYNPSSQKFFVSWREMPNNNPLNTVFVNHIRGSYVFEKIPANNVVISAISGNEDPQRPAVASSTTSEHALVVWEDSRNLGNNNLGIYGNVLKVADAVTPPPVQYPTVVTNTLDSGPGSLRQAMLNANAHMGLDTITFNIPGTGVHVILPETELPEITESVIIDGYTQPGSSVNTNELKDPDNAVITILLDGTNVTVSTPKSKGLQLKGGNSCVRGLAIVNFGSSAGLGGGAIEISGKGGNIVEGNRLGTDAAGLTGYPGWSGVTILGSPDNIIGGTTPAGRNIIFGGCWCVGIESNGATGNVVAGNYLGVKATGDGVFGKNQYGVRIFQAPSNKIGTSVSGGGNVIGGCGDHGQGYFSLGYCIWIGGDTATGNLVSGNLLGTNAAGSDSLPNAADGVWIESDGNIVGGSARGAGNVISGNALSGVMLHGCSSNIVQGNQIGTDRGGTKLIPNTDGVRIESGGWNKIGGTESGASNIISGNHRAGVILVGSEAFHNHVLGNKIGTEIDGISGMGNDYGVVVIEGSHDNAIGDTEEGAGNVIAYNNNEGVVIDPNSLANRINANSIYGNGRLGINLVGGSENGQGVTSNDLGDGDTGANNLQNFPLIGTVLGGTYVSLSGLLNSVANTPFLIEFFATPVSGGTARREGQTRLGSAWVLTDGDGLASFNAAIDVPVSAGRAITATATDTVGNTSEFCGSVTSTITNIAVCNGSLSEYVLLQNYPNPFNPTTLIGYSVPSFGHVLITVFNTLGQLVTTLVNDEVTAGYHEVRFDGIGLASGVYFCRMQSGSFVETKRLLIMK